MSIDKKVDERIKEMDRLKRFEKHPIFYQLKRMIADLMIEYGPDGHCDGSDIIASSIIEKYFNKSEHNG